MSLWVMQRIVLNVRRSWYWILRCMCGIGHTIWYQLFWLHSYYTIHDRLFRYSFLVKLKPWSNEKLYLHFCHKLRNTYFIRLFCKLREKMQSHFSHKLNLHIVISVTKGFQHQYINLTWEEGVFFAWASP